MMQHGILVMGGPSRWPFEAAAEGVTLCTELLPAGLLDLAARTDVMRFAQRLWPCPTAGTFLFCRGVTVLRQGRDVGFDLCEPRRVDVLLVVVASCLGPDVERGLARAALQFPQKRTGHGWAVLDDLGLVPTAFGAFVDGLVQVGLRIRRAANLCRLTVAIPAPAGGRAGGAPCRAQ